MADFNDFGLIFQDFERPCRRNQLVLALQFSFKSKSTVLFNFPNRFNSENGRLTKTESKSLQNVNSDNSRVLRKNWSHWTKGAAKSSLTSKSELKSMVCQDYNIKYFHKSDVS